VETNTIEVTATQKGAAFPGARLAWTSLCIVGANSVRTPNPVLAAGTGDARDAAFLPVPAMKRLALVTAELQTRKQYIHKTRMSAGGFGDLGPHPEREPAY
jgi:hypothetical protein